MYDSKAYGLLRKLEDEIANMEAAAERAVDSRIAAALTDMVGDMDPDLRAGIAWVAQALASHDIDY